MNRSYFTMMLVFPAVLVLVMGCRRAGEPQRPVDVIKEKEDFIFGYNEPDLMEKIRVKTKFKFQIGMVAFPPEALDPDSEIVDPDAVGEIETKMLAETRALLTKAREKKLLEIQAEETAILGASYMAFVERTKISERSFDNLKKDLRRTRKINIRKLVDNKIFHIVMDADPEILTDILAYRISASPDGQMTVTASKTVSFQQMEDLIDAVKRQQLRLVWKTYAGDPKKSYVATTPITQCDADGFKKFMAGNAVPSLAKLVNEKEFEIVIEAQKGASVNQDGAAWPQVFAWRKQEEDFLVAMVNKRGFLHIATNGQTSHIETPDSGVRLLDSVPRQQLWCAWRAYNDYVNSNRARMLPLQYDELRRYIKANTFPSVSALIDEGKMLVSDPANPRLYVACFSTPEEKTALHRAIAANGNVTFIPAANLPVNFPKR